MKLPEAFRSLGHPPFRRFFIGQTVSVIGFWLQQIALSWLVYRLTGSPLLLGAVTFCTNLPMLVVSPIAGMLVDRFDRRRVVIATQATQMLQALTLAALTFTGLIRVELVFVLGFVYGLAWSFDTPARQSLLVVMVGGKRDLPNAIALNSMIMNLARFLGPMIAGGLLALTSEAWCFLLNGLSYLAVLSALVRLPASPPRAAPGHWARELADGFRWVGRFLPARALMLLLVAMALTAPPYQSMMPVFAREVYHGDARIQGLLISCAGCGALAGTTLLATRKSIRGLVRVIIGACFCAGVALAVFALSHVLFVAGLALTVVGFGIIVTAASINTILQSITEDRLRGRVVSIYVMSFMGMTPLGSLALGALARRFGEASALASYGAACATAALVFAAFYPRIRAQLGAVYDGMGIERGRPG